MSGSLHGVSGSSSSCLPRLQGLISSAYSVLSIYVTHNSPVNRFDLTASLIYDHYIFLIKGLKI